MKDLIERQVLLDALSTWDKFGCDADGKLVPYEDHYIPYIHYDDVIKCIKGLPSVSTEKTGYWILLDECSNSGYYCSECHKKVVKEGWSETVKKIKFCPNCGIKILPQPFEGESEE